MYDYAVKKIAEHMDTIWITVSKVTFKVECAFNKCVSWSLNTHTSTNAMLMHLLQSLFFTFLDRLIILYVLTFVSIISLINPKNSMTLLSLSRIIIKKK